MKYILIIIALIVSLNSFGQAKILAEDLKAIIGSWEGSITYLDYQSGKPFTMPANVIVKQGKNESILMLKNIYPEEPKANGSDKIKMTNHGILLNKCLVRSREVLENGQVKVQTECKGKDDNKAALIRNTYLISNDHFLIRKEIQFEGTDNWTKRSEFEYYKKL